MGCYAPSPAGSIELACRRHRYSRMPGLSSATGRALAPPTSSSSTAQPTSLRSSRTPSPALWSCRGEVVQATSASLAFSLARISAARRRSLILNVQRPRQQSQDFGRREDPVAALRVVVIEDLEAGERDRVLHDVVLVRVELEPGGTPAVHVHHHLDGRRRLDLLRV